MNNVKRKTQATNTTYLSNDNYRVVSYEVDGVFGKALFQRLDSDNVGAIW